MWIEIEKSRKVMAMKQNCRMQLRQIGKEKDYIFNGSKLIKKGIDGEERLPSGPSAKAGCTGFG